MPSDPHSQSHANAPPSQSLCANDPLGRLYKVQVQADAFDSAQESADLQARLGVQMGGLVQFLGLVRGEDVLALELEHYPGMTEKALVDMAELTCQRFAILGLTLIHRVGRIARGEPIVLVIVAAAHRRAAFEGAHFLMDYLKTQAPFWKKEHKTGGLSQWVDAREADDTALARWGVAAAANAVSVDGVRHEVD